MKKKSVLKTILAISITILIFYLIFQQISIQDLIQTLKNANPYYLLVSLFPLALSLFFTAKRWQTLLLAIGYNLSLKKSFYILMAAIPLTSITPSKSGDVIRAYYLKEEIPVTRTIGGVLTERIFDVVVLISLSLLGTFYYQHNEFIWLLLICLVLILLLVLILKRGLSLPFSRSMNEKIDNIAYSMKSLFKNKTFFFKITVYSIVIWILAMLQVLMFFYALDVNVDLLYVFANMPIAIFVGMLPVTLGGMGTRDAAIIYLFSGYGTSSELLAVGILFSLFRYWLLSIAGLPFMKWFLKKK